MTVDLDDVQGLVVSAYAHLPLSRLVLVQFADAGAARGWLRGLLGQVTSAADGPASARARPAINLAFTSQGLSALGVGAGWMKGFSLEFQEGMDTPHRARLLGDEGPSARDHWSWGRARKDDPDTVHAMLMLFDQQDVGELHARHAPDPRSAREIAVIDTHLLSRDPKDPKAMFEHFGFHDGLSQPALGFGPSASAPGEKPLAAGEFLLGHPDQSGEITPGPDHEGVDLGHNGSYLVVRQLSQDVAEFWRYVDEAGRAIGMPREELAARMVGRRLDGQSLVDEGSPHDIAFSGDELGLKCPLGAHIRRSNPRDWIPGQGPEAAVEQTRKHRLLRRGRPYGPPAHPQWDIGEIVGGKVDPQPRGLVFMCLNGDIARQFEFVQSNWVMNPKFAGLERDADPLVGPRPRTMTIPLDGGRHRLRALPRFIELRGGGYFFLPGKRALAWLAGDGERRGTSVADAGTVRRRPSA